MTSLRQRHAASLRRCFYEFLDETLEAVADGDVLAACIAAVAGGFFFTYILLFDN